VVIAHAASPGAYAMALDAGVDFITHVPLGIPLPQHDIDRVASEARITIPTLTMMEGIAEATGNAPAFAAALATTRALHAAGVPILAGTDANATPGIPFQPAYGASLHHELELLVQAGLSPPKHQLGTALPAQHFALPDRGAITPGLRADLILLDADPTTDITATRTIHRVWCAGTNTPSRTETGSHPSVWSAPLRTTKRVRTKQKGCEPLVSAGRAATDPETDSHAQRANFSRRRCRHSCYR